MTAAESTDCCWEELVGEAGEETSEVGHGLQGFDAILLACCKSLSCLGTLALRGMRLMAVMIVLQSRNTL